MDHLVRDREVSPSSCLRQFGGGLGLNSRASGSSYQLFARRSFKCVRLLSGISANEGRLLQEA